MDEFRDRRVWIETYGCTYNQADSHRLAGILEGQGCTVVDDPEAADLVVINTCIVIGRTEREMLRRIGACADRDLVVTGCMPVVMGDAILAAAPHAHLVLPAEIDRRWPAGCAKTGGAVGILQVSSGCMGRCAYCITRAARGRLKSRPVDRICGDLAALAEDGVAEVQVTAQDVSAWGMDLDGDGRLPDLVRAMTAVPGEFRLRLGMMNPATVLDSLDSLVEACRDEKVFSFIHLPVQSGCDRVLAAMRRGNTVEEFERIVATFRAGVPGVRICTDIIVGYPTETEEDFAETLAMVERVRPDKVNITRYSVRPGTPAAEMKQVPGRVVKARSRLLDATVKRIFSEKNEAVLGRVVRAVVVGQKRPGSVVARDQAYREIVVQGDLRPGTWIEVEVTGNRTVYMTGRLKEGSTYSEKPNSVSTEH
ncbi:tRNA (N(6)-L-threonylcarbamoyladenosine(37)-C(2))-methylthiotransferase [Methanofollis aquaemaris]|uniref:tRNA-t(6)A37 methylthiotransferase n=1 Tax=Methanofollis aquaemaris TaxID=126734 RepID=A0A8A3S8U7_9EURY|nr:tRNA (N(6)-L-threonylcarbamoyladenosine(37)-C(2))-methylthiotransferase [Methanofollis aquaemaris]QSZ68084.1 tRNA (N(6)-L-threonylcarbamoyladenosine(37)-C(2))-methylthiotransferase [Methanofollis aquaemaris]